MEYNHVIIVPSYFVEIDNCLYALFESRLKACFFIFYTNSYIVDKGVVEKLQNTQLG